MNKRNQIVICKFVNNNICSKFIINYDVYSKWNRLENLTDIVKLNHCEIKYFDEENELISIKDTEDFVTFQNIALQKWFNNNEILVICYSGELKKNLHNYQNVKILAESKSVEEDQKKYPIHEDFSLEDNPSSSSSSSFELNKSRKSRSIKRYAADVKRDLNYLSGSEVSDGQTIVKRWQIKNVGMKKWKSNSVKCVLLPSEFSNWIQYEDIKVPVCFADQKVEIEIRIKIIGRWTEEQLNLANASQFIQLKWLLFMDKLIKENDQNFMDFILTQLTLILNVKSRNNESGTVSMDTVTNSLKKQTSESSIEKIDQDYSFVNMSDECENKNRNNDHIKLTRDASPEIELELPDCPNADDFQITDFNRPNSIISENKDHMERNLIVVDNQSSLLQLDFKPFSSLNVKNESEFIEPQELERPETNQTKDDIGDTLIALIQSSNQEVVDDKIINSFDENLEIVEKELSLSENSKDENSSTNNEVIEKENENKTEINENTNTVDIANNINDKLIENQAIVVSDGKIEVANENISNSGSANEQINVSDADKIERIKDYEDDFKKSENLYNALGDEISDVKSNTKNSLVFENTNKPDLTPLTKNPEFANGDVYNHFQRPQNNNPTPYYNNQYCNNNATGYTNYVPYKPGVIPDKRDLYRPMIVQPMNVIPPNIPYVNPTQFYQNSRHCTPVPPYPLINQIPIQNQSSDHIIRQLTAKGNIHNNINDYHSNTTVNLKTLYDMGFRDHDKNLRLLQKFQNNLQDVIHELID